MARCASEESHCIEWLSMRKQSYRGRKFILSFFTKIKCSTELLTSICSDQSHASVFYSGVNRIRALTLKGQLSGKTSSLKSRIWKFTALCYGKLLSLSGKTQSEKAKDDYKFELSYISEITRQSHETARSRRKMLSKLQVSKPRQRFTPWLEEQIESGEIDGLEWLDKDQGIFKVPWVRVDKPEFELETHAELFKRWASHTGKYRPGDQPDPSTWKTRFRCALRKMQEIVEMRHLGNLEGTKPYRAFKFEPKLKGNSSSKRPHGVRRRRRSSSSESNSSMETISGLGGQHVPNYQSWWLYPGVNEWNNQSTEPWYQENWDIYFPESVQNEFGYFASQGYRPNDQENIYYDFHSSSAWHSYFTQEGFNGTFNSEFSC